MVTEATSLPALHTHPDVLAWQVPTGWVALSSASVGGGLVRPRWVLNVGVADSFARTDLEVWAAEVAGSLGLTGPGCALLTAADVHQVQRVEVAGPSWPGTSQRDGGPVLAWATVGVTKPTWAVRPVPTGNPTTEGPTGSSTTDSAAPPGTINIVVSLPVPLSPSALVQALGTITEAKAQALVQAGVPGTGTASDAVVVLCPDGHSSGARDGAVVPFAGVRSPWGSTVAAAVHEAVVAGLAAHPWPPDDVDPGVVW